MAVFRHVRIAALVRPDPVNGRWPYDDPIRGLGLAKKGAKLTRHRGRCSVSAAPLFCFVRWRRGFQSPCEAASTATSNTFGKRPSHPRAIKAVMSKAIVVGVPTAAGNLLPVNSGIA